MSELPTFGADWSSRSLIRPVNVLDFTSRGAIEVSTQ